MFQIKQIRAQTRAEKKKLAMAVREKQLLSIGMKTNKKGQVIATKYCTIPISTCLTLLTLELSYQVVATSRVLEEASNMKDETGVICSICREGYHNQPTKVSISGY